VGRHTEGAARLVEFLAAPPEQSKPALLEHLQRQLTEAKAKVAVVTLKPDVNGATLFVNGKTVDGKPIYLAPGHHKFEARADKHTPATVELDLAPGTEREVALDLIPIPAREPHPVPGNGHQDNGEPIIDLPLPIIAGVLGLAGIGLGVGFTIMSNNAESDRADLEASTGGDANCAAPSPANSETCAQLEVARDDRDRFRGGAIASYVVGGALVLASVGLFVAYILTADDQSDKTSSTIEVRLGPTGIQLNGAW
jgi:hypothetical protein